MLTADDPLPFPPRRVLVAGVTGSGKTTLASRIGARGALPHVEIDALFHGPEWVPRSAFLDDVRAFAAEERWVTEWQYTSKGTDRILAPRAHVLVWLDYPYPLVRRRLLRRTLRRRLLRTRLWNGNVEPPLWTRAAWTGENDILRWQRDTRHKWEDRMPGIRRDYPNLAVVRLRHPRDAERWLDRAFPAVPR